MSTKSKKIYFKRDIEEAIKSNDKVKRYYSRKSKRRKTVQIRLSSEWHNKLKKIALKENMVMSCMLDKICEHFFKHYSD